MRTIYLLRHAQAEYYAHGYIGRTNYQLSLLGLMQAEQLRNFFTTQKSISAVFTSPLLRCQQTAARIAAYLNPFVTLDELIEIDLGDWEGCSFEQIKQDQPQLYEQRGRSPFEVAPPNGENFFECFVRGERALRRAAASSYGDIAVVAHAGVNRALVCHLTGMPQSELFSIPQPFGCINTFLLDGGVLQVEQIGSLIWEEKA